MVDLKRSVMTGAVWMVSMRAAVNILGLLSTIVLARLLTPADFGVVALAGSAYAFFSLIGQFGFDSALIHHRNPSDDHYNTAWTANILVGLIISALMFAAGRPAAQFFGDSRIEYVVYAFSLLSLAKGFENIGVVNFRKNLKFGGDFLYFVIPKISAVIAGISAALVLRSYWALVIGMVTSQFVTLLYSHFSQPFRPRLSLSKLRELFGYSQWIVLMNILRYMSTNGIDIALGKLQGTAAVGVYGIAKQIAYLPSTELLAPINRALFPGFASVSDQPDRLRRILTRVVAITALISIPAALGIVVLAEPLVFVLLGQKWAEAAPLLEVLGLVGLVTAIRGALGPVLLARGRPKVLAVANVALLIVVLPLVLALVPRIGIIGVAYASLAGSLATTPILLSAVYKDIGFGLVLLLRATYRPVLSSVAMALSTKSLAGYFSSTDKESFWSLVALVTFGASVYVVFLIVIWWLSGCPKGAESEAIDQIKGRLGLPRFAE